MKKSVLFLCFFSVFWIYGEIVSAQTTMILELENSESETYDLIALHKVTFSDEVITLNFSQGTSSGFNIESISKIFFTLPASIESLVATQNKVTVMSNPAGEYIYIKYDHEQTVRLTIISLEGKTLATFENIAVSEPIYVGNLSSGFYLLKINHHIVKLHKI